MDNGGKRKRDSDQPRITYHTADRTFDRLFKEKSLNEMKSVVRQKLGLSPVASIHLAQLREDKRIDLEDDDDFDAFLVVIHSTSLVNVMVTWSTEVVPTTFTELVTGDCVDCSLPKTTPIGASTKFPTTSRDSLHANDRTLTPVQPDHQSPPPKRKKRKVDLGPGSVTVEPKDGLSQIARQGAVTVASSIPNASVQDGANVLEGNISISAPPVPQKASQIRPTAGSTSQRHTRSSLKLAQAAAQTELPKGSRDTSRKAKEFPSQLADAIVKSSTVDNSSAKATVTAGKSKGEPVTAMKPQDRTRPTPKLPGGKKRPIKKASPAAELEGASNTSKDREKLTGNTQQPCTETPIAPDSAQAFEDIFQRVHAAHKAMVAGNVSSLDSTPHLEKKSGPDTQKPPKTPSNQRQSSASHSQHDQQPKPKAGSTKSVICPVCMGSPLHARYECPVIMAGADALEKRIFELRKGKNIAGIVGSAAQLTDELRAMVNKIRGPTTAANASSPKQPAISKIQPIPRPLSSSNSSSSSESEELEPLPTATSVGAGNEEVSGIDLESLIRGPIARVSDLVSPESSEEELNGNSHLEEDSDEGAKRPKGKNFGRKKTARHVTDSSDEGEDEQVGDQDTRPNDNAIGSGGNHFRIGSTSFRAVDILGESVPMDQSGNDAASNALAEDAAIHNLEKDSSGVSPKPQTQVTTDQQGQAIENMTLPKNSPHSADARKPPWGMDIEDPIEPADDPKLPQCSPIEPDSHPHVAPLDVTCDLPQTHPIASPNQGNEVAVDRGNTSLSKCISENNHLADADLVKTPISSPKSLPPRARMRQGKHTSQPLVIPSSTKKSSKNKKMTPAIGRLSHISQDQPRPTPSNFKSWAILSPAVDADSSMMTDELRSSSPGVPPSTPKHDEDKSASKPAEAPAADPLFIPSESQAPFPYSQWVESIEAPQHSSPPDDQDSEDEDEVAATIKAHPKGKKSTSYRSLTDIASQQSLFPTPGKPQSAHPPRTRNKTLSDLYGRNTEDDSDDGVDSDSEVEAPSHIPASRRAGTNPRR